MVDQTSPPSSLSVARGTQALSAMVKQNYLPRMVAIFAISLFIPMLLNLGSVRLSVYRIVLLLMFFPALVRLLSGAAGRIRIPDIAVIVICIWSCMSIMIVQGPLIETMGILFVETLGGYLIARCYIRTPEAFLATVRLFFVLILIACPLALYESVTGREIILEVFDKFGSTYTPSNMEKRMGMFRAQGPFAHPIHFGLFFGAFIGMTYYVLGHGKSFFARAWRTAVVAMTGALAFSSGPLTALTAQLYIIVWDRTLSKVKARWYILGFLTILAYITIDLLSNRNPFQVFISYMAFNSNTAYNRIYIWIYGTASILANPLWGIGLTDNWARPYYMSPSADMFWILPAMRHGIVVGVGYFAVLLFITVPLMFRKFGPKIHEYRLGFLTSISGMFMAGWTVHYWDAVFVFFMFLLGSGVWMLDYKEPEEATEGPDEDTDGGPAQNETRYSRSPVKHTRRNLTDGQVKSQTRPKTERYARKVDALTIGKTRRTKIPDTPRSSSPYRRDPK